MLSCPEAERSGDVIVNGERIQMYREKESTHTAGSFLSVMTIKRGAVSVMTERDSPVTTYYNLKYDGDDWLTTNPRSADSLSLLTH